MFDPPSSETPIIVGAPMDVANWPTRKDRRVHDRGSDMMDAVRKRAEETLDYSIDLSRSLEPGESVVGVEASRDRPALAITGVFFVPRGIVVWLSGGGDGERAIVSCVARTSGGRVKSFRFVVLTRGRARNAPPTAVVTISVSDVRVRLPASPPVSSLSLSISDATLADEQAVPLITIDDATVRLPSALGPLSTSGNQIVDASGKPTRLISVNWFGAEGSNNVPHGLWARGYKSVLDQIKGWGFNSIRYPFSGDTFKAGSSAGGITAGPTIPENDALVGKTPLQVLDIIVEHCREIGLRVVLDHHRRATGSGADGSPTDANYTEASWRATWTSLARHFAGNHVVVGADLHNEPHDLTWDTWAALAEGCADAIHAENPDWLIFVEGVGANPDNTPYWWGGALKGVNQRPVRPAKANKLVYSPHEYGQSVGTQTWLAYDGQTAPGGWPGNLFDVWRSNWGFIFENGAAPIWIGEFGGHFGARPDGTTAQHGALETQWASGLLKYLNGDFDNDGTSELASGARGMSAAYWGYPPISGDTGGLLRDDWTTVETRKLDLLAPLLTDTGA